MSDDSHDRWRSQLETKTKPPRVRSRRPTSTVRIPKLTLLAHPDPDRLGEQAEFPELATAGRAVLSRLEPLFTLPDRSSRRPLADPHLSRQPVFLRRRANGTWRLDADQTSTPVTVRNATHVTEGSREIGADELEQGVVILLAGSVALWLALDEASPARRSSDFGLIGNSSSMIRLRQEIERAADLEMPVLIRGETGTGKELVAQALHRASRRRSRALVTVNMAALPPSLAVAELFGAAAGAFTGAGRTRRGFFGRADGGTLFLDEIGEASVDVQVLLLRALESGEIQPLGAEEPRPVDVRLVAATDADLEAAIEREDFRAPLLHRLSGYEIRLPSLQERREDIPQLLLHFLKQEYERHGWPWNEMRRAKIPLDLMIAWVERPWPGNVRQLRNVARKLAVLVHSGVGLESDAAVRDLLGSTQESPPEALTRDAKEPRVPETAAETLEVPVRKQSGAISEEDLVAALRAHRYRLKPAAAVLGISRPALYRLIEKSPRLRTASQLERPELEAALDECGGDLDRMSERLEISRHGLTRRMNELGLLGLHSPKSGQG